MPILHMETEVVRGVGNQLQQATDFMFEQTQQLSTTIQSLSSNWQGLSADLFISDMHSILQQLSQLFNTGTTLNQSLQREVDEWEQADSNFLGPSYPNELNAGGKNNTSQDINGEYAKKLLANHWANLSEEDRMEFVNDYIEDICREYGIPIPKIQFIEKDKMMTKYALGEYDDYRHLQELFSGKIGSISISLPLPATPSGILMTAAHETRHAMQHYYVEHPDRIPYDQISGKPLISEQQLKDWKYNFEHPIDLSDREKLPKSEQVKLGNEYYNQAIEADARNFGDQYFDQFLEDFQAHEERGDVIMNIAQTE